MSRRVLFILNTRSDYYGYGGYGDYGEYDCGGCGACANCMGGTVKPGTLPWSTNSGLYNSSAYVVDMLNAAGVAARMIQVDTTAAIDEAILGCDPTDVIFEAFFVTPDTVKALAARYPLIRWWLRNHSEIIFLSHDSHAMDWLAGYLAIPSMSVSTNTARAVADLRNVARAYYPHWDEATVEGRVALLPNYHPMQAALPPIPSAHGVLNVGCMGAIRPPKNTLEQAICAMAVARDLGKRLRFHVNDTRVQHGAAAALQNLRALFGHSPNAELVGHDWLNRSAFYDLCRHMDIGMQVSAAETFNLVTADFVTMDRPIVVSPEIPWTHRRIQAQPTQGADIIAKMHVALRASSIIAHNRAGLLKYDEASQQAWLGVFGQEAHGWTDRPKSFVARPALAHAATHL